MKKIIKKNKITRRSLRDRKLDRALVRQIKITVRQLRRFGLIA